MSKTSLSDFHAMRERTERARNPEQAKAKDAAKAEKFAQGQEKELSRQFCAYLTQRGVPHIVARTDRKSNVREGWPDVTAMYGCNLWDRHARVCCVELKCEGGRLSAEQIACHAELAAVGIPVLTAYNLADAIAFVRKHLRLDKPI